MKRLISVVIVLVQILSSFSVIHAFSTQNVDGNFGLSEGCTGDIIDISFAQKALADWGETEAKIKYILPTRKRTL